MFPSDVKKILGEANYEGENDDKEVGGWINVYIIGNRTITFFSETNNLPVTAALISVNQ